MVLMSKVKAKGINGKRFEKLVSERFNLTLTKDPTHRWDAYTKNGEPVSIKTTEGNNNIIFGDIFRQAYMEEKGFWLIVGFIDVSKDSEGNKVKSLEHVYVMPINSKVWKSMFSPRLMKNYEIMMEAWGKVPAEKEDKIKQMWDHYRDKFREEWAKETRNIIRPRPKWQAVDKKTGLITNRIQCEMRHEDMLNYFINNDNIKKAAYYSGDEFLKKSTKKKKKTNIKITEDFKNQTRITEISIEENEESLEELKRKIRNEEMNVYGY